MYLEVKEAIWPSPNGNPMTMAYRDETSDWNTINSCLGFHDEYGLKGRTIRQAIDIGGYLGSVGVTIAVDNPEARVLIVEPVPPNVEMIQRNIDLNNVGDRVTIYHGAVGPKGVGTSEIRWGYDGEDANLLVHAFVGNSSLSYDTEALLAHRMDVETLGLAALLDRFGIKEADYTKIDCEGGEWTFLTAPKSALKRLTYITGEVHSVRGHKGKDIEGILGGTHDVELIGNPESTCEFTANLR
jgi:FkbM family methyltransferase